jgi:hypothetical protein
MTSVLISSASPHGVRLQKAVPANTTQYLPARCAREVPPGYVVLDRTVLIPDEEYRRLRALAVSVAVRVAVGRAARMTLPAAQAPVLVLALAVVLSAITFAAILDGRYAA